MSAGKGDRPRNCFSKAFCHNYDSINWDNKNYAYCRWCEKKVKKADMGIMSYKSSVNGFSGVCARCLSSGSEQANLILKNYI